MNLETTADIELNLKRFFGEDTSTAPLGSNESMGRRIFGVDLTRPLTEEQAELIVGLLDRFKVISFPDQGKTRFRVRHLERLANYFGAPIPHPKNYANYIDYKKKKVPLALLPVDRQTPTLCDQAFPETLQCLDDANSPAVYIVTNLVGSGPDKEEEIMGGYTGIQILSLNRHRCRPACSTYKQHQQLAIVQKVNGSRIYREKPDSITLNRLLI